MSPSRKRCGRDETSAGSVARARAAAATGGARRRRLVQTVCALAGLWPLLTRTRCRVGAQQQQPVVRSSSGGSLLLPAVAAAMATEAEDGATGEGGSSGWASVTRCRGGHLRGCTAPRACSVEQQACQISRRAQAGVIRAGVIRAERAATQGSAATQRCASIAFCALRA